MQELYTIKFIIKKALEYDDFLIKMTTLVIILLLLEIYGDDVIDVNEFNTGLNDFSPQGLLEYMKENLGKKNILHKSKVHEKKTALSSSEKAAAEKAAAEKAAAEKAAAEKAAAEKAAAEKAVAEKAAAEKAVAEKAAAEKAVAEKAAAEKAAAEKAAAEKAAAEKAAAEKAAAEKTALSSSEKTKFNSAPTTPALLADTDLSNHGSDMNLENSKGGFQYHGKNGLLEFDNTLNNNNSNNLISSTQIGARVNINTSGGYKVSSIADVEFDANSVFNITTGGDIEMTSRNKGALEGETNGELVGDLAVKGLQSDIQLKLKKGNFKIDTERDSNGEEVEVGGIESAQGEANFMIGSNVTSNNVRGENASNKINAFVDRQT